ncbi:MAG: amino acid ABC transporter permease [candidate division Zixibacteria bacterium]|nr:amino acid ABC transporter permease [candidate division Zixibacteria bacterium]
MELITGQIELLGRIFLYLLPALPATIYVTVLSFLLSLVLGLAVGMAEISPRKWLSLPAKIYVDTFRGIPLLVLIFFFYFGLGTILNLERMAAGIIAIGVCYAAYQAEIFRSGIEAISHGQYEAALSLGMTRGQVMRHVILPQSIRIVLPPTANEFIACLKDSSLVSIIGLREITRAGREFYSQYFVDFQTWFVVGLVYLIMTLTLSRLVVRLEKRFAIVGYGKKP